MRDWDRNGRIDARDRYIFHEIILKENTAERVSRQDTADTYGKSRACGSSSRTRSEEKKSLQEKVDEMSWGQRIGWAVFWVLAVMGLFVS